MIYEIAETLFSGLHETCGYHCFKLLGIFGGAKRIKCVKFLYVEKVFVICSERIRLRVFD